MVWRKVANCFVVLSTVIMCATTSLAAEKNLVAVPASQVKAAPAVIGDPEPSDSGTSEPKGLIVERFSVREVKAYPSIYDEETDKYYMYLDLYRNQTSLNQTNWLELSPSETSQLINEFKASSGVMPTDWYVSVTCNMQNINRPLYYICWLISNENDKIRETAFNGDHIFNCAFPILDTSESYYNGVRGVAYYNGNMGGQVNASFSGVVRLNNTVETAN